MSDHDIDEHEIEIQVNASTRLGEESLDTIVIIPIINSPIFPGMIAPIVLGQERFTKELEEFISKTGHLGLNLVKFKEEGPGNNSKAIAGLPGELPTEGSGEEPQPEKIEQDPPDENKELWKKKRQFIKKGDRPLAPRDIYSVGVICKVVKKLRLPDGSVNLLVHGLRRYRAVEFFNHQSLLLAKTEIYEDILEADEELDAYTRSVINQVKKLSEMNPYFNEEMKLAMLNSPSPGALADLVAFALSLDVPEAQDFLETLVVKKRFAKLLVYLKREKEVSDIQKKITDEVNDKVNKYQREYFLREQLKVIRHELGMEEDDKTRDIKKIKDAIEAIGLPEDVKKVAMEELEKLESIPESGPEYNVTRSYLNWIIQLPWQKGTVDDGDIKKARTVLENDHYGLEKAKERILEFLAVRKLRPQYDGTILCFAGPPGVGKTSLGKSIASALGREFFRFSLGGMRDEAEIKGHRRTYVGAMPGKLIQALKRVAVNNPVIMLDEIDKMGQSFQGDPAAALLEVLDPEQNSKFIDNYLDVPFDLSKVLFIATANYLAEIPEPLLDRMEVIELSGYTIEEKIVIARKWVIPKQLKKHGLNSREFSLSTDVLKKMIADYAREPGVRALEQAVAKLCRKAALYKVEQEGKLLKVHEKNLKDLLGSQRFFSEEADKVLEPGVVIGLAWTSFGGDILMIESIPLEGKGVFKLTGQLGEVMNESANLAYSYVKKLLQKELNEELAQSRKEKVKNKEKERDESKDKEKKNHGEKEEEHTPLDFLSNHEIHLHLPAGATPKDGPSAGITMALALYSLAHDRRVKSALAMTGELSLTGKVLPIGGLKEKLLAAKRAGIKHVIIPEQNKRDLREVPELHMKGLKLYAAKHFDDVLKVAFTNEMKPLDLKKID